MVNREGLTILVGVCVFLANRAALSSAPPQPHAAEDYVFVQDLDRRVGVHRGEWNVYGQFNAEGELLADGRQGNGGPGKLFYWMGPVINNLQEPQACFELHSGRLVKGVMDTFGHFTPDLGSQVTKFEDYKYSPEGLHIWNLPGSFMRRDKAEERRKWLAEHLAENPDAYGKEKARLDSALDNKK
jgi:hypothetical protein